MSIKEEGPGLPLRFTLCTLCMYYSTICFYSICSICNGSIQSEIVKKVFQGFVLST